MKAVLSNRIYLDYTEEVYQKIKDELTFKLPPQVPGGRPTIVKMFNVIGKVISIPIGCASIIPESFTVKDVRVTSPVSFPEFRYKLREDQQEIYDQVEDSCLINANPSWGKTFTAISIAAKLNQKTLVICHNTILRDQWAVEIKKTLGLDCGIIGSGKFNHNSPITVSNIQTLRKHANKLSKEFGLVIVDEVHRAPAKIFSDTLNTLKARYKIGLSATLQRKDGLHVSLPLYFSEKLYVASKANQMQPEVHIFKVPFTFPGNILTPWAIRLNDYYNDPSLFSFVSNLSRAYVKKGHKLLIVADRVEFLESLAEDNDDVTTITGKTADRDARINQIKSGEKKILAGTTSIFKEGVSVNELSCLIIAVPINNMPLLEQLVGRVQRKLEGKPTPIVVDIVPKGKTSRNQGYTRAAFYKKQGYKITLTDLTNVEV